MSTFIENIKYARKVDKSQIPTCNIMGVNIAAINMVWLLEYLDKNIDLLHGDYMCVTNVHTTAYSVGTPVYGSRIGNVGNLIEDRKTGMLLKGDSVKSISETLKCNVNFDCAEIYNYYLERYTAERNYEILVDIYSKCIDSAK